MRFLALFFMLALLAPQALAKITDAQVRKEDRLLVPLDEPFGFSKEGRINITLSNFSLRPLYDPKKKTVTKKPNLGRMGLLITTPYGGLLLNDGVSIEGQCPLDSEEQITLVTFDEIDVSSGALERDFVIDYMLEDFTGGEFLLYFANCEADTAVDFDITLALYNLKANNKMDFLPVGEDILPTLYFFTFIAFTTLCGLWGWCLVRAKNNSHKVHIVMAALLVFKSLTVLTQSGMYHMIGLHGHPEGWNIAYYIFTAMRSVLFFVVVILIATGWSYMKPFLADREKQILMIVVPLQVFANVAIVVMDETTPASRSWFSWRDLWHVVDILCCCAVLFPIVWSIRQLREAADVDDKAARVLGKLVLFRQFYIMVVAYIYFTRIIVYLLDATLQYKLIWLSDLASEVATLVFYIACGLQFRPLAAGVNPYFALDADEIELVRASIL
ncbi:putative Protein CANDIDATE G-PROTEIN COUPLED RECEPTOR 7 [Nannochloris sp. 'desiccata']|nr:hypothetical protein KSW81_005781 [Chlorella desiccata (nom. nud.)]KAH7623308.1 putative Protein CANDIDATE G-PROTEIN COUPLED RECEPTOR 7 [Chlorella desiccata (nom. nud.)]